MESLAASNVQLKTSSPFLIKWSRKKLSRKNKKTREEALIGCCQEGMENDGTLGEV